MLAQLDATSSSDGRGRPSLIAQLLANSEPSSEEPQPPAAAAAVDDARATSPSSAAAAAAAVQAKAMPTPRPTAAPVPVHRRGDTEQEAPEQQDNPAKRALRALQTPRVLPRTQLYLYSIGIKVDCNY